jgi:hypothetical protein
MGYKALIPACVRGLADAEAKERMMQNSPHPTFVSTADRHESTQSAEQCFVFTSYVSLTFPMTTEDP